MLYNMDHFTSSECVGFRYAYTSWRPGGLVFPDGKDSGVGLHLRRLSSFCFHLLLSTFDWGVDFFFLPAPWRGIFTDMIFVLYFFFFFGIAVPYLHSFFFYHIDCPIHDGINSVQLDIPSAKFALPDPHWASFLTGHCSSKAALTVLF